MTLNPLKARTGIAALTFAAAVVPFVLASRPRRSRTECARNDGAEFSCASRATGEQLCAQNFWQ